MIPQDQTEDIRRVSPKPLNRFPVWHQAKWIVITAFMCTVVVLVTYYAGQAVYQQSYRRAQPVPAVPTPWQPDIDSVQSAVAPPPVSAVPGTDTDIHLPVAESPNFIQLTAADRLNILLIGVDARPDDTSFPRTDTLMLMSWDRQARTVDLLSIPRDLWVPVPGHPSTKINLVYSIGENEALGEGGSQLLRETIQALINQPVHHHLWINFDGFVSVVDQIGGIDLYVPWAILDEKYPTADYGFETFELAAGYHHLDGATALKYARTRTQDGDYSRISRQQAVVEAILRQITNPAHTGRLVLAAPEIARTILSNFDSDLTIGEFMLLVKDGQDALPSIGTTLVLDSRLGEEGYSDEGMWVLVPDRRKTREIFAEFFQVTEVPLP